MNNKTGRPASEPGPVDVLIVTAVQDELDGLLAISGREGWIETRDLGGFRYYLRSLPSERGGQLVFAAAWLGQMGERTAALRGQQLVTELEPECLAMCGICAGDPKKVARGDVIVADQLYPFDEGKRVAEPGKEAVFYHAIRTFDLQATWKTDAAYMARELDLKALAEARPPSLLAQRRWLLQQGRQLPRLRLPGLRRGAPLVLAEAPRAQTRARAARSPRLAFAP